MIARVVVAILGCACAGAMAGKAVGPMREHAGHDGPRVKAVWAYRAGNATQMAKDVDAVVLARHQAVRPGRTVLSSLGEAPLAFERNEFVVLTGFKGLATGDRFVLERVASRQPRPSVSFDADGGAYAAGQRYLLFLKRQVETGMYIIVNDEARYGLDGVGRLQAIRHDPDAIVSRHLAGRRPAELPDLLGLEPASPK